jgi:hypothetical protein
MKKLKHLFLFESFVNENSFYDLIKGYAIQMNKEEQVKSGFVVGEEVEWDFKNNKGEVVQTSGGKVEQVGKSNDGKYIVVIQGELSKLVFGSEEKFHDIKDLRKK